eukprot:3276337-Rhodomonas_salina.1
MDAVFGAGVMLQKGDKVCGLDTLPESGVIGLYFSAQWCMPCRGFTPKLAEAYRAVREAGKAFEVIYLSADKDEVEFGEYFTGCLPCITLCICDAMSGSDTRSAARRTTLVGRALFGARFESADTKEFSSERDSSLNLTGCDDRSANMSACGPALQCPPLTPLWCPRRGNHQRGSSGTVE